MRRLPYLSPTQNFNEICCINFKLFFCDCSPLFYRLLWDKLFCKQNCSSKISSVNNSLKIAIESALVTSPETSGETVNICPAIETCRKDFVGDPEKIWSKNLVENWLS